MKKVVIIGSGPRGLSVLERLVVLAETVTKPLEVVLIDDTKIAEGRIWDSKQSKNYIMNTLSTEISAFSGHGPVNEARAGYGPSFAEWWQTFFNDFDIYQGFAPRAYYGQYLNFVYQSIKNNLPCSVHLLSLKDQVLDIEPIDNYNIIHTLSNGCIKCDSVVITTGHSKNRYEGFWKDLQQLALTEDKLTFIAGDSSSSIDFSHIAYKQPVGVIGLGLAFFDVVSELTEGRGGQFVVDSVGSYRYVASGKEPSLYCGSRSGLPILARGRNEKIANYKHNHHIFTKNKIKAKRLQTGNNLNFKEEIWSLLEAEVNLAYFKQQIVNISSHEQALQFQNEIIELELEKSEKIAEVASKYISMPLKALDLHSLARPFDNTHYQNISTWQQALKNLLVQDLQEAEKGNLHSPIKSALDVLRYSRDQIRTAIDFGGLTPKSHQEFLNHYVPIINLLSAGPPLFRLKQLLALIDAGIVSIVPPKMIITATKTGYQISAGSVPNYHQTVTTLIDARIPTTNIYLDKNPLIQNLLHRGVFTSFKNVSHDNEIFDTGGVNVTSSPFNPINSVGKPQLNLFVLGIPTEHTRWFMQSGSSRPSYWIDFMIDADSVARAAFYGANKDD